MTSGDDPLEPSLDFPPIVRPQASPTPANPRLPVPRLPGNLPLSTIALASGIALALEGVRLAVRATRKRNSARNVAETSAQVTVSYQWTQVVYERHERS